MLQHPNLAKEIESKITEKLKKTNFHVEFPLETMVSEIYDAVPKIH